MLRSFAGERKSVGVKEFTLNKSRGRVVMLVSFRFLWSREIVGCRIMVEILCGEEDEEECWREGIPA